MYKTKIRILDCELDVEVLEQHYGSEKTADGSYVLMDQLAVDCAGKIQLDPDSTYPPVQILRNGEWIEGRIFSVPLPPDYKIMFLHVKKENQEG